MFITFEGIDGSGKSTQVRILEKYFKDRNIEYIITREPGGTPAGEEIRKILKSSVDPVAELLLFYASRVDHVNKIVKPALEEGRVVICDRFEDSTIAYQHYGRGLDLSTIKQISKLAIDGFQPDLTILLEYSPEHAVNRMQKRELDTIENESIEFHKRVSNGYKELSKDNKRFLVIDASLKIGEIAYIIRDEIDKRMKRP